MARIPGYYVEGVMRKVTKGAQELGITEKQREALIQMRVLNYELTPTEEEEMNCGFLPDGLPPDMRQEIDKMDYELREAIEDPSE